MKYGANDLGSIMIEENVVSQAGTTFCMDVGEMKRLISDLGYEPRQRDNWYRLVDTPAVLPARRGCPGGETGRTPSESGPIHLLPE